MYWFVSGDYRSFVIAGVNELVGKWGLQALRHNPSPPCGRGSSRA